MNELFVNRFIGDGQGHMFHSRRFFDLHDAGGLYLEWGGDSGISACAHFSPESGGIWRSPRRGTYAGLLWQPELPVDQLFYFYDAMETKLRAAGACELEVLLAPMAHDPAAFALQTYVLRSRGFHVSRCDINQSLDVGAGGLAERMSYGNQKRLRKCAREGLEATLMPRSALLRVYETLELNRRCKGYVLSMTLEQLEEMVARFPDGVLLFGVKDGETLAASAICLRVAPHVLYVFYWGDRPGYESASPVVPLAQSIYRYCQQQSIRLLDVGTSTIDKDPNFGLIQFKRNLGFSESLKLRMNKVLRVEGHHA